MPKDFLVRYDEAESWSGPGSRYRGFDTYEEAVAFAKTVEDGSGYYKVDCEVYELRRSYNRALDKVTKE